jgi:hypothetical protein
VKALAFALALASAGCGYHALHGGGSPEKLRVELGTVSISDSIAADEVTAAAREALAKEGALGGGTENKLVIEVTRIDETAEAIAAPKDAPFARSVVVAVVGRGTVYSAGDSKSALRDTGARTRSSTMRRCAPLRVVWAEK